MVDIVTGIAVAGFLGSVATGGAVWGSTRTRIRTVEQNAKALADRVQRHEDSDTDAHTDIVQRLARMETTLERIDKRI